MLTSAVGVEVQDGVFAEATRVVVHQRLRVAKGLEQRVDLPDIKKKE